MDAPMFECRNLRRTFQRGGPLRRGSEIVAVSDISFDVRPGSIFGLLGPNGAGKTTTVRMLSTLLLPTTGSARVAGFDVASQPREVRRRTGLALGGDRGLFGRLTAEQNLQYFGAINHLAPREANRRSDELLELVGLGERRRSKVFEYSRGMKQRLHLARALLTEPDVLFLDEPTAGLDPLGAYEFRQLVGELKERGRTILLTTHFMLEADELVRRADRDRPRCGCRPGEPRGDQASVRQRHCRRDLPARTPGRASGVPGGAAAGPARRGRC